MIDSNKMIITTQDSKLDMPLGNHFIFLLEVFARMILKLTSL